MDPVRVNQATEHELNAAFKYRSGAFFFLREDDHRDLSELVKMAGMEVSGEEFLEQDEPWSDMARGIWGPLFARARLTKYAYHRCLEIYFSHRELVRLVMTYQKEQNRLERDPYWPVAVAFRRACEQVSPEVAFVISSSLAANSETVDTDLYDLILSYVPDGLLRYPFNLLYFDAERSRNWTHPTEGQPLVEIGVSSGRLLFERYKPFDPSELEDAERELKRLLDSGELPESRDR